MLGGMAERGRRPRSARCTPRPRRPAPPQVGDVVGIRPLRRFVEPFGNHQLGGGAGGLVVRRAAREADARPDERLRRLRDGRGAEAKRQAQANRPLVELDRDDAEARLHDENALASTANGLDVEQAFRIEVRPDRLRKNARTPDCPSSPACAAAAARRRRLRRSSRDARSSPAPGPTGISTPECCA